MTRECEICGRTLKTGRKYCYEHRGYRGYSEQTPTEIKKRQDVSANLFIWIVGIIASLVALYFVYIFLIFLVASFILPVVCGIYLFFKIRKIKRFGIKELTRKEIIIVPIAITLFLYSLYWWGYFIINGKTLV